MVFEKEYVMWCSSAEWIAGNWVPWDDAIVVSAGKMRKLWDSLSELRSCLCDRRLERIVLRPALLPVKIAQFILFSRQVWRHKVKSLSLTESVQGALEGSCCWRSSTYFRLLSVLQNECAVALMERKTGECLCLWCVWDELAIKT